MNLDDIIKRLCSISNIKTEGELANKLNIKPTALSERKRRNSIPYKEILALCEKEKINIHWVFTGEGIAFICEGIQGPLLNEKESEVIRLLKQNQELIDSIIKMLKGAKTFREGFDEFQERIEKNLGSNKKGNP